MEHMEIEGFTASELGKRLGRLPDTVKKQLKAAGEKPIGYIGPTAVYAYSSENKIRNVPGKGRPPKAKAEPAQAAAKPKMTKK